jgi:hypothetical protein
MGEDERSSALVFVSFSEKTHELLDTYALFPRAVIHCHVNNPLFLALQSIDCGVHSAFYNKARHVSLFLLADPEDSAERLLLNLYWNC